MEIYTNILVHLYMPKYVPLNNNIYRFVRTPFIPAGNTLGQQQQRKFMFNQKG